MINSDVDLVCRGNFWLIERFHECLADLNKSFEAPFLTLDHIHCRTTQVRG